MRKMGFNEKWVFVIMSYVTIVSYVVLINGQPGRTIQPTKGIRQGDPTSPCLFLLCTEVLSALLTKAKIGSKIKGIKVAIECQSLCHLFSVDEIILFCRAKLFD